MHTFCPPPTGGVRGVPELEGVKSQRGSPPCFNDFLYVNTQQVHLAEEGGQLLLHEEAAALLHNLLAGTRCDEVA